MQNPVVIQEERGSENLQHAGWMALRSGGRGCAIETTIDPNTQSILERIVAHHTARLPKDLDIAVVLVETASGEIRGLIGSSDPLDRRDGQVNGATARRSPGSALKPFIYAAAFEAGILSPDSIVEPRQGDRLVFDDGPCIIRPRFRIGTTAHVFLDGAPIDHTEPAFSVSPGSHELRIVEAGKPPHVVRFEVIRPR